jgi:TolB-like protein/Flp pilus assembly protein TadD
MPRGAVFLSYASQDADAAKRICEALRAFGVEVWFDQAELRGGDAWDAKIRKQIRECALFLPVISATTQERGEGYFRREWKLAVERTHDMAEGVPFIVPVVVDDIPEASALVPEPFLRVQWTRLPHGLPTPQFVEQVKRLLGAPWKPAATGEVGRGLPTPPKSDLAAFGDAALPGRRPPRLAWLAPATAVLVVIVVLAVWQPWHRPATAGNPERKTQNAEPSRPPVAATDKSIAVLPFTNMSDEKDTGFFADGVHEDILTNLQNVRALRVLSRQSVQQYRGTQKTMRQIGQELGVGYLLEGSVRRAGNTVRVTGQLIDARTEAHLWADKYDRDLTDIFAIQSELAQAIAAALQAAISPQEKALIERRPTENSAAYDLYLKAREIGNAGRSRLALEKQENLLESAVTLDPKFAVAWAELSFAAGEIYIDFADHTEGRRIRIKTAVDTAFRLAPEAPEVIRALGDYYTLVYRDYARADEQYQKLLRMRPNDPRVYGSLGNMQFRQGRWGEALASYNRSLRLDPKNITIANWKSSLLRCTRRYDEAIEEQRRRLEMAGRNPSRDRSLALLQFLSRGSTREMETWLAGLTEDEARSPGFIQVRKDWARMRGDFAEAIRLDRLQPYSSPDLNINGQGMEAVDAAWTLAATGDRAGAAARLENLPARIRTQLEIDPTNSRLWSILAQMEAVLGHKEEAIRCARQATELLPVEIDRFSGPTYRLSLAIVYTWMGEKDCAIDEWARRFRSEQAGDRHLYQLKYGPWAFPLRGDPRWEALLNDPKNNAPLF